VRGLRSSSPAPVDGPSAELLACWADACHAGVQSHCMFARQGVFRERRTAASLVVRRPAQVFRPGSAECRTALQVLQDAQHAGGQQFDLPRTEYKGVFARGEGGANLRLYMECGVLGIWQAAQASLAAVCFPLLPTT
jgi:hypothetical protein